MAENFKPLPAPPRAVRPVASIRRRRAWTLLAVVAYLVVGLSVLGFVVVRRSSLIRHAVQAIGRVVRHHITHNKATRFTLYVEPPARWGARLISVDVDSETYDRAWIGDEATFYLDATDPENASQDRPSTLKLIGLTLFCLALGSCPASLALFNAWQLTSEQKLELERLRTLPSVTMKVTEVGPSTKVPNAYVVDGGFVDADGKRWLVQRLRISDPIAVGDEMELLFDSGEKWWYALSGFITFEPTPSVES